MVNKYPTKTLLKKFWEFLSEFRYQAILAIILTIISVYLFVQAPKLLGKVVNSVLDFYILEKNVYIHESFDELVEVTILYVAAYALKIPISRIMAKMSEKAAADLKSALNDKLTYLSPNVLNHEYSGNVLARLNNDVANIKSFVSKSITVFLSDLLIIIFVIIAAMRFNAQLSLIFICVIPFYLILTYIAHKKTVDNYKSYQDILGQQMGVIGILLPNRFSINSFNAINFLKKHFKFLSAEQRNVFLKSRFYSDITSPISSLLTSSVQLLLYLVAGYMVVKGTLSLGEFSTFALYFQLFKKPFLSLNSTLNTVRIAFSSFSRVLEILELPEGINPNAIVLDKDDVGGEIEFKDISYNNISNLNLKIQSGEIINIVGGSKDDLIDLLLLFNKTDKGKILLDGEDISQFDLNSYRSVFGVSLDDDWIVSGSVRDNISYAKTDAEMDEIVEICRLVGIDELIEKYPDKYDTKLSNDFQNFSSGEGKLICVARALIANPKILILNYPNYLSVSKLKSITRGKTAIILTPDETFIDFADKTINLDNL
jgi:ATP-binding cassette subfamily B protein